VPERKPCSGMILDCGFWIQKRKPCRVGETHQWMGLIWAKSSVQTITPLTISFATEVTLTVTSLFINSSPPSIKIGM